MSNKTVIIFYPYKYNKNAKVHWSHIYNGYHTLWLNVTMLQCYMFILGQQKNILFVMNTSCPQKIILNMVPKNKSIDSINSDPITLRILNAEYLLEDLKDIIALGKFVVFVFTFKEKTRCFNATYTTY